MSPPTDMARRLALDFVARTRTHLAPYLLHPSRFESELAGIVAHHREDNDAYQVDAVAERILVGILDEYGIAGRVFSEESGWGHFGAGDAYTIVCDPFDNSFLSTRAFRDSATVISIGDEKGRFLCCAIGDLATSAVYIGDESGARVFEQDDDRWRERAATTSTVRRLEDAFVVLPAFLRPGRPAALDVADLIRRCKHLLTMDGAIFFGRLAAGYIDAYVDVVVGQPVYEVTSVEMISRAGGVVTDRLGEALTFERILEMIERDPEGRTGIVAAATPALHAELLAIVGA
jgi:fructose-1,6-bisphosphatase/inositol monophosphatase family enzyme